MPVNVLVCIKRVPATGARISLTEDELEIETRNLGFTIGPHEECAIEEAIRLVEKHGGNSWVLTLGAEVAKEQLRDAMAMGIDQAIHLPTDGQEWDPMAVAEAITSAIHRLEAEGTRFDMLLFGNEAADSGDYQVGVRVAYALGLPCLTGVKALHVGDGGVTARREVAGGWESFEVPLPALFTVKEGINLPRYPSLPGRMRAKKKPISAIQPLHRPGGLQKLRLKIPPEQVSQVEILGEGPEAATRVVQKLRELGVI
jgi:electron transfer flavoprotein beta subunit